MKSGLLAFGAWSGPRPLFAQAAADPLAPLPTPSGRQLAAAATAPPTAPAAPLGSHLTQQLHPQLSRPRAAPARYGHRSEGLARRVRRDRFRQLGVGAGRHRRLTAAACSRQSRKPSSTPPGARRSSTSHRSRRCIAEAPELPQADQLAAMALKRGALTPPAIGPEKPRLQHRLRADPLQGQAGAGRALRRPAPRPPRPTDQGRRRRRRRGPAAPLRAATLGRSARRSRHSASPSLITSTASTWMPGALPTRGGRARRANGRARRHGSPGSPHGASATGTRRHRIPAGGGPRTAARTPAGGYYWAARAEQAARPAALGRGAAQGGGACAGVDRKLLRPARPRNSRRVDQARGRSLHQRRSVHGQSAQRPAGDRTDEDRRARDRRRNASPPGQDRRRCPNITR